MIKLLIAALSIPAVLMVIAFTRSDPVMETVPYVDLERFMGDWYVVAGITTFVERNAVNSVESYSLRPDGDVDIRFSFNDGDKRKQYTARGFVVNRESNADWKVQFFPVLKFPYKVIDIAPDYNYSVVGVPNRKYVWIMSRFPEMDAGVYDEIVNRLKTEYNYDISKIRKIEQDW